MEKILVNLSVPAIGETYDMFVPIDLKVCALIPILTEGIRDLCNGQYGVSGHEMLSSLSPEILLHPELTLSDYNIRDGAHLMLL